MFKAVQIVDGIDIIILDPQWEDELEALRALDRQDILVCQECRQPVRVRAGEVRIRHFAHKHRENCTLESEPPELLNARAVLYEKLRAVFGDRVTIEKKLDPQYFRRPVDCWVEDGDVRIAYWVLDRALRPEVRMAVQTGFEEAGALVHWVFTGQMLHESKDFAESIILTTTEREFMRRTPYDEISGGETLHYLDADNRTLTTFRALRLVHDPNLYRGHKLQQPLSAIEVALEIGSFVYPGEKERLEEGRRQRAEQERQRIERERMRPTEMLPARPILSASSSSATGEPGISIPEIPHRVPMAFSERKGICVYCGQETSDWWSFDGKTGTCKCNACSNPGRVATAQFRVPLALDEQDMLVPPATAEKGQNYRCPACHGPVILRKGDVKVAHFAHHASNACSEETILHQTAKLLIQRSVRAWKAGDSNAPVILRACQVCNEGIETTLSRQVCDALLEYRLEGNSVADVALMGSNTVVAAVEIRVSHAVDESKAMSLPVPFVELDGEAVLATPNRWQPLSHNLPARICPKCMETYDKFVAKANGIAAKIRVPLPASYYRYSICSCYRCSQDILVYTWPNHGLHDETAPAALPVPRTIQFRYSKTANGKYWVNTCPHCQAIQGDFYLYAEPDGPFFGTDCGGDTPDDFRRDMTRLAHYADYLGVLKEE